MAIRQTSVALLPWLLRGAIAAAVLAAPLIYFEAFSNPDAASTDPILNQKLHEAQDVFRARAPRERPKVPDPSGEAVGTDPNGLDQ